MDFILIAIVAFSVSALTLYSGFGLGTLLMPVFALFFPVEMAIVATAIVHGANSIFKVAVIGKHASKLLVLRFGITAIIFAFLGARALSYVSDLGFIATYSIGTNIFFITPIKLSIAIMMLIFAVLELSPSLNKIKFDNKYLPLGGALSGFFGGFSGHQGALRAAFLTKTGISTETFVGTSALIGFMVDTIRIGTYVVSFFLIGSEHVVGAEQWPLIITGMLFAFIGVMLGKRYLHKITMRTVQKITGILLLVIAFALGFGLI